MQPRQYYYLISGLPNLFLDLSKPPVQQSDFLEELEPQLAPEDFAQIHFLLLPADNHNLWILLQSLDKPLRKPASIKEDFLRSGLTEPSILPPYMKTFIVAFREQEPLFPGLSWENQLTTLFYDYVLEQTTGFLHEWFAYDRDLRNICSALSIRRNSLRVEGQFIGQGALTEALHRSHTRDFGLASEFPDIEQLLQWEDNTWLDREIALDTLRWNHLDELNTFRYFTVELLLAYYIKLDILQRWSLLQEEAGAARFRQLVNDLEHSIRFTHEFALS